MRPKGEILSILSKKGKQYPLCPSCLCVKKRADTQVRPYSLYIFARTKTETHSTYYLLPAPYYFSSHTGIPTFSLLIVAVPVPSPINLPSSSGTIAPV